MLTENCIGLPFLQINRKERSDYYYDDRCGLVCDDVDLLGCLREQQLVNKNITGRPREQIMSH